ncbi:MAG: hypothetical protein ACRCZB_09990 [Bacteroidales bacterium]
MPSFFKLDKPKGFHYQPRFYDERKEAMEQRIDRIKAEMGMSDTPPGVRIRGSFQAARRRAQPKNIFAGAGVFGKVVRLASIVLIAVIAYFLAQALTAMLQSKITPQPKTPNIERYFE